MQVSHATYPCMQQQHGEKNNTVPLSIYPGLGLDLIDPRSSFIYINIKFKVYVKSKFVL